MSAPAAVGLLGFLPEVEHGDAHVLPVPFGITVEPRPAGPTCDASMPRFTATSTALVELGGGELFHHLEGVVEGTACPAATWPPGLHALGNGNHGQTSTPPRRRPCAGGPRDGAHGRLEVGGREVRVLVFAMSSSCFGDLADLAVFGVPLPFSMPIALRISTDAGGVFMMKVKLRSL